MSTRKIQIKPQSVCCQLMTVTIDENYKIINIIFEGGCQGNLKALSKLLEGRSVQYAHDHLRGILCGNKNTSCADQLAKHLVKYIEEYKAECQKKKAKEV